MKAYYEQMTLEELKRTFYVADSEEDAKDFWDMCIKAGANTIASGSAPTDAPYIIGVGAILEDRLGHASSVEFYKHKGLQQISWKPIANTYHATNTYPDAAAAYRRVKTLGEQLQALQHQYDKALATYTAELEVVRKDVTSIGGIQCTIEILPPSSPIDINDPDTWKDGDVIECCATNTDALKVGNRYTYIKGDYSFPIRVVADETGRQNGFKSTVNKFQFVRRPVL